MRNKRIKYFYLPVFLFIFFGCSPEGKKTTPKKKSEEIIEIMETLEQQEKLLERLQALTADQILRNSELEQAIPPRDLLESLQNGFVELQGKTRNLQNQLSSLKKSLDKISDRKKESKTSVHELPSDQKQILMGMISLQSGNPNQAKEYMKEVLSEKKPTKLKESILMALGHSFFSMGYPKQAASHYGIFLREYPKSSQVPQALYFLGEAMQDLGEQRKKRILWQDLIKNYPGSSFSKRAKKSLSKSSESKE